MPRLNIYLKNELFNEVRDIVAKQHADGATRGDISQSSLAGELVRLGLMIYRRDDEEESKFELQTYRRELIRKTAGAREGVLMLIAMMTEMYLKQSGVTDPGKIDEVIGSNLDNFYKAENDAETKHFVVE